MPAEEQAVQARLKAQEEARRLQEVAEYHYGFIRLMANNGYYTKADIRHAFHELWAIVPDYDPDRLKPPAVRDLLPQPFDWVPITAGKVKLEDVKEEFAVEAFHMAKYPVTVAQYQVFMADEGYTNEAYWTAAGWQWRTENNITEPREWRNKDWQKRFYQPTHPIVGISWYEAMAFCAWLQAKAGENVHLPSEQQWQRAAEGDKKFIYPWGNDWDGEQCNHNVYDNYKERWETSNTSPVTAYEGKGDSPFRVVDMAGNVWEWCLTNYETGLNDNISNTNNQSVRGGSWDIGVTFDFRANARFAVNPKGRGSGLGFRLVLS